MPNPHSWLCCTGRFLHLFLSQRANSPSRRTTPSLMSVVLRPAELLSGAHREMNVDGAHTPTAGRAFGMPRRGRSPPAILSRRRHCGRHSRPCCRDAQSRAARYRVRFSMPTMGHVNTTSDLTHAGTGCLITQVFSGFLALCAAVHAFL